jgi:hypothetical protein
MQRHFFEPLVVSDLRTSVISGKGTLPLRLSSGRMLGLDCIFDQECPNIYILALGRHRDLPPDGAAPLVATPALGRHGDLPLRWSPGQMPGPYRISDLDEIITYAHSRH